jgi:anti-sigma28 factor (negative regulator of flagellin synthesis)
LIVRLTHKKGNAMAQTQKKAVAQIPSDASIPKIKEVIRSVRKNSAGSRPRGAGTDKKRIRTRTEVREDLVNKYKTILKKGNYRIKDEEIADKMVQKIREDKNQVFF